MSAETLIDITYTRRDGIHIAGHIPTDKVASRKLAEKITSKCEGCVRIDGAANQYGCNGPEKIGLTRGTLIKNTDAPVIIYGNVGCKLIGTQISVPSELVKPK